MYIHPKSWCIVRSETRQLLSKKKERQSSLFLSQDLHIHPARRLFLLLRKKRKLERRLLLIVLLRCICSFASCFLSFLFSLPLSLCLCTPSLRETRGKKETLPSFPSRSFFLRLSFPSLSLLSPRSSGPSFFPWFVKDVVALQLQLRHVFIV